MQSYYAFTKVEGLATAPQGVDKVNVLYRASLFLQNCINHITLPFPGQVILAKSCQPSRVARAQVLSVLPSWQFFCIAALDSGFLFATNHCPGEGRSAPVSTKNALL